MKFVGLTPELLWPLLGGLAVIVALLYVLKLRRRRVTVPFSPIWGRVVVADDSRRWWERLKRLLSYLIQLLFVGLLILALADPRPSDEDLQGRHIVLLLDTSASMTALDVSGAVDRFDVARQEAVKVVESMGPNDAAMLVTMDGQLRPLTPFVKETAILTQTIKDLKPTATPANITEALAFVRDATRDKPGAEIYLFSDGAFAQDWTKAAAQLPSATVLHHIKTGEAGQNVAITAFTVRRYLSNKLDYEILVELRSTFKRPVSAELKITSDGQLVDRKVVEIKAEGTERIFYPREGFSGQRLEARVVLTTADARDVFPLDDVAYALLPSAKQINVLLVSEGNLYLEAPLVSNDNVSYARLAPSEWDPAKAETADIVIFDRMAPPVVPAEGNLLFVDPPVGDLAPWKVPGDVDKAIITRTKKKHPILRWVSLKDLNIGSARKLVSVRGDEVVASAFGDAMIVARREDKRNLVALAFDVRNSDLPLRVALPVLFLNIIDYLLDDDASLVPTYRTGEVWSIPVSKKVESAKITDPSGASFDVPVYDGRAIFYGQLTGFHTLVAGGEETLLAANLSNPSESTIQPPDELVIEGREVHAGVGSLVFNRQEYWILFALLAIGLLLVEWLTYNRRWTV